jgi:hypothetical protein
MLRDPSKPAKPKKLDYTTAIGQIRGIIHA